MKQISDILHGWYGVHKRDLPWRNTSNPYKIWLSEIILQQTRVDQGLSYYEKFVRNYPTVEALANASEEEVLRDWQGLGYYSRARNLHATAKFIRDNFGAVFPRDYEQIKALKGVGDYTAAAIASFAYHLPYAVVDGNVFRVLARLFGIATDISSSGGKKEFYTLAQQFLDTSNPALHNQAMMEFGALQCVPSKPDCSHCVLSNHCFAFKHKQQALLPVKLKKTKVRDRFFNYLIIEDLDKLAFSKRGDKDIWSQLYEFPLVESALPLSSESLVLQLSHCQVHSVKRLAEAKHILSHQRLHTVFWKIESEKSDFQQFTFFSREEIKRLPKPVLVNNFLVEFYF